MFVQLFYVEQYCVMLRNKNKIRYPHFIENERQIPIMKCSQTSKPFLQGTVMLHSRFPEMGARVHYRKHWPTLATQEVASFTRNEEVKAEQKLIDNMVTGPAAGIMTDSSTPPHLPSWLEWLMKGRDGLVHCSFWTLSCYLSLLDPTIVYLKNYEWYVERSLN